MYLSLFQVDLWPVVSQSCHIITYVSRIELEVLHAMCDVPWPDLGIQHSSCFLVAYDLIGQDVIKRVTSESVDQDSVTRTFKYWP